MRRWIGSLLCALVRHPPRTWGQTDMEDAVLEILNRPTTDGETIRIYVNCVCGRKVVPFRAKPS